MAILYHTDDLQIHPRDIMTNCQKPPNTGAYPSQRASDVELWGLFGSMLHNYGWTYSRVAGDWRRDDTHVTSLYNEICILFLYVCPTVDFIN